MRCVSHGRPAEGLRVGAGLPGTHRRLAQILERPSRLSHPLSRFCPMSDLLDSAGSPALDPAAPDADPAGTTAGRTGDAQGLTLPADGLAGAADDAAGGRAVGVAGAVGARLSHPLHRVWPMNDFSIPSGALDLDPAGPAADPTAPAVGRAGLAADPAGAAGDRAGDARGLALPGDGRTKPGLSLAGGRAVARAGGPAGAVGQVREHEFGSDFTNRCNCRIVLIRCAA